MIAHIMELCKKAAEPAMAPSKIKDAGDMVAEYMLGGDGGGDGACVKTFVRVANTRDFTRRVLCTFLARARTKLGYDGAADAAKDAAKDAAEALVTRIKEDQPAVDMMKRALGMNQFGKRPASSVDLVEWLRAKELGVQQERILFGDKCAAKEGHFAALAEEVGAIVEICEFIDEHYPEGAFEVMNQCGITNPRVWGFICPRSSADEPAAKRARA